MYLISKLVSYQRRYIVRPRRSIRQIVPDDARGNVPEISKNIRSHEGSRAGRTLLKALDRDLIQLVPMQAFERAPQLQDEVFSRHSQVSVHLGDHIGRRASSRRSLPLHSEHQAQLAAAAFVNDLINISRHAKFLAFPRATVQTVSVRRRTGRQPRDATHRQLIPSTLVSAIGRASVSSTRFRIVGRPSPTAIRARHSSISAQPKVPWCGAEGSAVLGRRHRGAQLRGLRSPAECTVVQSLGHHGVQPKAPRNSAQGTAVPGRKHPGAQPWVPRCPAPPRVQQCV